MNDEPSQKRIKVEAVVDPTSSKPIGKCHIYELELELRRKRQEENRQNAWFKNKCLLPMLNTTVFCHNIMPFLEQKECLKLMNEESLATFGRVFDITDNYCVAHAHPLKKIDPEKDFTSEHKSLLLQSELPPAPPDDWKALNPSPNSTACIDCLLVSKGYQYCPYRVCTKISKWNEIVACNICKNKYCHNCPTWLGDPFVIKCRICRNFVCKDFIAGCLRSCGICEDIFCVKCEPVPGSYKCLYCKDMPDTQSSGNDSHEAEDVDNDDDDDADY